MARRLMVVLISLFPKFITVATLNSKKFSTYFARQTTQKSPKTSPSLKKKKKKKEREKNTVYKKIQLITVCLWLVDQSFDCALKTLCCL